MSDRRHLILNVAALALLPKQTSVKIQGISGGFMITFRMSKTFLAWHPSICSTLLSKSLPPTFLAPSLATATRTPSCHAQFSTSPAVYHRRRKGVNPNRGVSPLRRTGLQFAVGMSKYPLPKPVLDPKKRTPYVVYDSHGLWGFFNKKRTLLTEPSEERNHGMYIYHRHS